MNAHARPVAVLSAKVAPSIAMSAATAAASLDISLTTFLKWVEEGKMPKGTRVDGSVRYDTESVRNAWRALKDGAGEGDGNELD